MAREDQVGLCNWNIVGGPRDPSPLGWRQTREGIVASAVNAAVINADVAASVRTVARSSVPNSRQYVQSGCIA